MNWFLKLCLERTRTVYSLLVLCIVVGIYARAVIPIEANPDVQVPVITIAIINPGISPEDAERLLVKPVELELRAIDGIDDLHANAQESVANFTLEFDSRINIDVAMSDVRAAVERAREKLPETIEEPVIKEVSADDFPTMVIGVSSASMGERELYNLARELRLSLEMIPDVLDASLVGSREEMVEVEIDRDKLANFQITPLEIIRALDMNNQLIPAGEIDTGSGSFNVKVPGLIETYFDVINLPIKATNDGVVVLSDIAKVNRRFKDRQGYSLYNGVPTLAIEVQKRVGSNQIDVANQVRAMSAQFAVDLPDSVTIEPIFDQTPTTQQMVTELQGNIGTAICLVMIIVVAALGFRSGFLVGASIPVSLLIGISWLYVIGYSFNFMVMFGMLLALGMLIDSSIVITEYADRRMAEGASSKDAYVDAVSRMFWPVAASTATTLAAFLPMMLWPGVVGQFMGYLPTTVFAVS